MTVPLDDIGLALKVATLELEIKLLQADRDDMLNKINMLRDELIQLLPPESKLF